MNSGAEGAENFLEHSKWSIFPPPNTWQMMTFLNPLDALRKKTIPIFHFLPNFGSGSPPGPGVSLSRIFGGASIEPSGGGWPEGCIDPPAGDESPPTPCGVEDLGSAPSHQNVSSPRRDWLPWLQSHGPIPSNPFLPAQPPVQSSPTFPSPHPPCAPACLPCCLSPDSQQEQPQGDA